jgi:hypothetical protein
MIGMVAALEHPYRFYPRENVLESGLMLAGIVSQPHFRSAGLPIVFILAPNAITRRSISTRPKKAVRRLLSVSSALSGRSLRLGNPRHRLLLELVPSFLGSSQLGSLGRPIHRPPTADDAQLAVLPQGSRLSYNKFRQAPIAAERRRDHAALHVGQIQHMIAGVGYERIFKAVAGLRCRHRRPSQSHPNPPSVSPESRPSKTLTCSGKYFVL